MAAVGPLGKEIPVQIAQNPVGPMTWLQPQPGQPLHFAIAGAAAHRVMPFWQVTTQTFTCFPVIEPAVK